MAYIQTVTTHLPAHRYSTQEIAAVAEKWLQDTPHEKALFSRLANSTRIDSRHFALPLEQLITLRGSAERARVFSEAGAEMLSDVICKAFRESGEHPHDVQALLMTSCSVPTIPSIDARIVLDIGIPPTAFRLPIYQYGCAGGAIGLALGAHFTGTHGTTLLAAIELCSLLYQGEDVTPGNIVGSTIFGDGAACVVLSPTSGPLRIEASQSLLIPHTYDLMGYDILDDGAHLNLDRHIPQVLLREAPSSIESFLRRHDLSIQDVRWWLFHPGGTKILQGFEDALGLQQEQTYWSWASLKDHGNMSSASILFALSAFISDREYERGDKVIMVGIGPGLTLQLNLLHCC